MSSQRYQPYGTYRDLPRYARDNAPRYMKTVRQLRDEFDLRPAEGVEPAGYVDLYYQAEGPVALFNLFETKPL